MGTPNLFSSQQGHGSWLFAQLAKVSRANSAFLSPLFSVISTNGEYWLDNDWGYMPEPRWTSWPADSLEGGSTFHWMLDMPYSGFLPGNSEDEFKHHDKFKTYQMFRPPGTDSQWVPLAKIEWGWDAEAARGISSGWPMPPGGAVPGSWVGLYSDGVVNTHPTWEHLFSNVE